MMHTKVIVVDGIWSMFGSANFDNRSLELNDELNVTVGWVPCSPASIVTTSVVPLRRRRAATPA